MLSSVLRHQLLRKSINVPKHIIIEQLVRFLSREYRQMKYIVRITSDCVVGGWREIKKTGERYFNMKLHFERRKNCLVVHFSEAKACKGTDI